MDELTRAARAAHRGAAADLEAIVRASYSEVWRLCSALVDPDAADDLAQEAFMRVTHALPGFRGEVSARLWILAIARRTCADELRRRYRRARRDGRVAAAVRAGAESTPSPAGAVELRDLLGRLDRDQRAAFVVTQLLGLSYAEAAEVCECPVGTIRSRVARARSELVARLGDRGDLGAANH